MMFRTRDGTAKTVPLIPTRAERVRCRPGGGRSKESGMTVQSLDQAMSSMSALLISDAERIPAARYFDADFYRLECERLWPHVWQMACRLEQIPKVGDWAEYTILDQSVI